jgi:hypothetical protein
MLMGPRLVDGITGSVVRDYEDPNHGSHGGFKSEISSLNCHGNVTLLTSFSGLHIYRGEKPVQTIDVQALTGSPAFYPFGNAILDCKGDLALLMTPKTLEHRTNHTLFLLDVSEGTVGGKILHTFPTYAPDAPGSSSTDVIGFAMSHDLKWVAISYPAAHGERGKVDLFRSTGDGAAADDDGPTFELFRTIDCSSCDIGTRFGLDVDLTASGDRLLVTMRSQDVDPSVGDGSRTRNLDAFHHVKQRDPGMRTIAYLFNQDGAVIQTFRHDEREDDGIDFVEVDWTGQISTLGDRVTMSSWFNHDQLRTFVFDADTGEILFKSKTDYLVAVNADQRRGIGLATNPDGIYIYSFGVVSASPQGAATGGIVAAVLAVLVVGFALLFAFKGRRRSRRTMTPSGTADAYQDEPGKETAVELPPVD